LRDRGHDCRTVVLPVCVNAVFDALGPDQRDRLAATIVTGLSTAAARHQRLETTPKEGN